MLKKKVKKSKKESKTKKVSKWENEIYAYALKNAIEHEGKAKAGAVISGLFSKGLKREEVKEVMPKVQKILDEVNSLSLEKQKKELEKYKDLIGHRSERVGLPELPNVPKTGIITRFAPSASGFLHVGHVISNIPASLYVKKYGGKFYVRIEDTDPERVDINAYEQIKKDCDWIFGNVYEYIIQSDRMEIYYKYIKRLLEIGAAYVCTCNNEEFKEIISRKEECPCRKLGKEEHLKRWKKMLDPAGFKEGEAVVRFKSDVKHPNPAFRDFPLARINEHKHPRVGNKYRVWPLMNLSVAVDDIEYGMTHIIRGKDHRDNAERQKMIYHALGLDKKYPWTFFMGRIKFSDIELSKRKIIEAIKEGKYSGFEDIRLPTIASLRKRGYKPEAFAKFAEQRGLSEVDKVMNQKDFFKIIDNFNKEVLAEERAEKDNK
ncbi:MAG: glutamate--tRNA ligase family protein [Candidatus Pacearchaeota archaeon]